MARSGGHHVVGREAGWPHGGGALLPVSVSRLLPRLKWEDSGRIVKIAKIIRRNFCHYLPFLGVTIKYYITGICWVGIHVSYMVGKLLKRLDSLL
jgi:hypothetical protein